MHYRVGVLRLCYAGVPSQTISHSSNCGLELAPLERCEGPGHARAVGWARWWDGRERK